VAPAVAQTTAGAVRRDRAWRPDRPLSPAYQVAEDDPTRGAIQFGECVNVAAHEGFEALAISGFDKQDAAVHIDEAKV
jgi:hypothetical protein